jgi:pyridoxal biosynthesis lyase PdxS
MEEEVKHPSLVHFREVMSPFESAERNAQVFVAQNQLMSSIQEAVERLEECARYTLYASHMKDETGAVIEAMKESREINENLVNVATMLELEMGISA